MNNNRQEDWSGLLSPPPGDLPNLGIEPRSPTLHTDSLPSEPPGKPWWSKEHWGACIFTKYGFLLHISRDCSFLKDTDKKKKKTAHEMAYRAESKEMWNMELWFRFPRVSWAVLCFQHQCARSEHSQTRELTPGFVSRIFTGAPSPRNDWRSIQLISGSNLSRGAADIAWLKPLSWITSFSRPKVFTLSHSADIPIRLAQDPQKNKSTFLSVNLWHF